MSMIGNFRLSSDDEIRRLLSEPERITALLYPEGGAVLDSTAEFDVDKAWHAIHFLLCGQPWEGPWPLNFVVAGGTPVGDVDVGYGPARAFTSAELTEIVRALAPVTAANLRTRFDAAAFSANEIYPEIWDEPETECLDEYVLHYFERLKEFLERGQMQGEGLIVYLN